MGVLDPFVVPPDVVIRPVGDLPADWRDNLDHKPGDCVVTRPRSRTTSSVVDARTASLLQRFRTPTTIVDAVIAVSTAEGLDPRTTLDDVFAVLAHLASEGFLVEADSEFARPITSTLKPGDRVSAFEIVEPRQVFADTEVYLARGPERPVAVKLATPMADARRRAALIHEACILHHLDERVNPRLLEQGDPDGRPFLVVSWCAGVDVVRAAEEARALEEPARRDTLLALAQHVIEAYAHLHLQGVLHGDVHPRNVLVGADGGITLIDFGLAAMDGKVATTSGSGRGGSDFFMEPEAAAARLAGDPLPALSVAGEQYSVAALVHLVLTGAHTHAFSLESEEMLRQLVGEPPRPFDPGATGAGVVERTVRRALSKDPARRYDSVPDFLRAFVEAAKQDCHGAVVAEAHCASRRFLDVVLARVDAGGDLFSHGVPAPTASPTNGAAGIAYALLRIAEIRGDERLLALADVWLTRARLANSSDDGFWNPQRNLVPETIGSNSLHHHASGVHCVEAMIARARGDESAQARALRSFINRAAAPCERLDVTFGRAGLLLGACLALEGPRPEELVGPLRSLGERLRDDLWAALEPQPPLADGTGQRPLGAAHGWAGQLFALLRWSEATAAPPPAGVQERVEQLAELARPTGRGLCWSHEVGAAPTHGPLLASWCNGAAGYVPLWLLAHRQSGDERYASVARRAAWTAAEAPAGGTGDICCGFAGRAYALLSLYRYGTEFVWLARARHLAELAATSVGRHMSHPGSLYQGDMGVALLAAEVTAPDSARLPLYEREGWSPSGVPADS